MQMLNEPYGCSPVSGLITLNTLERQVTRNGFSRAHFFNTIVIEFFPGFPGIQARTNDLL